MTFRRVWLALLLNPLTACALPGYTDAVRSAPRLEAEYRYTTRAVSADGETVIGDVSNAENTWTHAFRYTEADGLQDLGTFGAPYVYSTAAGVSADGQVVVGKNTTADFSTRRTRAFRWTPEDGMTDLGTLGGDSDAVAVSRDGGTVVGYSFVPGGERYHAFRWTETDGIKDLGTLGGSVSVATAVSADGSEVMGYSDKAADRDYRKFVWTEAGGMKDAGPTGSSK